MGIRDVARNFKRVSINNNYRMSIKQGSVGVMLTSHVHVHSKFNTFLPNKLASGEQFHTMHII